MPSAYVAKRSLKNGGTAWRVLYRLGGRESALQHGGSFRTSREAKIRRDWIGGELAAGRVPNLRIFEGSSVSPRLRDIATQWQASRVDISENTRLQHRSAVNALLTTLGHRTVDSITPSDVAELVAALTAKGRKRETVRKSVLVGAMILDYAGVTAANPFRDKITVKLPREQKTEIKPPTADHVQAVHDLLPLATGCRSSCSTPQECDSVNSRGCAGAMSTSNVAAGASRRP